VSEKQHNQNVKHSEQTKHSLPTAKVAFHMETALHRTLNGVRRMTREQRRKSLVEAGIITSKGKLASSYR
jgi:hypothetical protein